jgi:hypothetical protein
VKVAAAKHLKPGQAVYSSSETAMRVIVRHDGKTST